MEVFWIAGAVAIIAWTQAKEEIFREVREWFECRCKDARSFLTRKLCYIPTCEFCLSFWVALLSLVVFRHRVAYDDWRGVILAQFATWGLANIFMTGYSRFRVDIRKDQIEIKKEEAKIQESQSNGHADSGSPREPTTPPAR